MKRFGIIGKNLSHSFSPSYFTNKFKQESLPDYEYRSYELDHISDLNTILDTDLIGLNVTMPFKQKAMAYMDWISEEAIVIGAINTIKFSKGKKFGYNTDCFGFKFSLEKFIKDGIIDGALVLGTGGSSRAVRYVLGRLGIQYQLISRTKGDLLYSELSKQVIHNHHLIINTSPVGMYPRLDECPLVPYQELSSDHYLLDLIYNPQKSLFLKLGEARNAHIMNGLEMLHFQAEKSWNIWTKT